MRNKEAAKAMDQEVMERENGDGLDDPRLIGMELEMLGEKKKKKKRREKRDGVLEGAVLKSGR